MEIQSAEIYRVHSNGYSELVAIYDNDVNGSGGFKEMRGTK
jgi:hypothetical protein